MPYVWIDDCSCDTDRADRIETACEDAIRCLRSGDEQSALDTLCAAIGDPEFKRKNDAHAESVRLYQGWRAQPAPRPGFLEYAHHQRRLTRI